MKERSFVETDQAKEIIAEYDALPAKDKHRYQQVPNNKFNFSKFWIFVFIVIPLIIIAIVLGLTVFKNTDFLSILFICGTPLLMVVGGILWQFGNNPYKRIAVLNATTQKFYTEASIFYKHKSNVFTFMTKFFEGYSLFDNKDVFIIFDDKHLIFHIATSSTKPWIEDHGTIIDIDEIVSIEKIMQDFLKTKITLKGGEVFMLGKRAYSFLKKEMINNQDLFSLETEKVNV